MRHGIPFHAIPAWILYRYFMMIVLLFIVDVGLVRIGPPEVVAMGGCAGLSLPRKIAHTSQHHNAWSGFAGSASSFGLAILCS